MDLVGEHAAAAWKSVNRSPPSYANLSMFGVLISLPKAPTSEKPRSSATITRKFGRDMTTIQSSVETGGTKLGGCLAVIWPMSLGLPSNTELEYPASDGYPLRVPQL